MSVRFYVISYFEHIMNEKILDYLEYIYYDVISLFRSLSWTEASAECQSRNKYLVRPLIEQEFLPFDQHVTPGQVIFMGLTKNTQV